MGVTATNVPEFRGQRSLSLSDLQDLAEVVKALMLQSDAPPGKVRTGSVKVPPAHDIPGSGLYFSGVFYEQPASRVARNGTIKDIHWSSGIDRPAIARGHALLPLAETVDASGAAHASPVAGGLSTVRVADSAISAPRILPGGILELPRSSGGGDMPLAEFGRASAVAVPGAVRGLVFAEAYTSPAARDGCIYFPFAHTEGSGLERPGVLRSVSFVSGLAAPRIVEGALQLPPGGGEIPLAAFGSSAPSGVAQPGALAGLSFESGIAQPRAYAGNIYFPLANYNGAGTARPGALQMVEYVSGISAPRIWEGSLQLPQGGSGGGPAGVQDVNGSAIDWQALGDGAMRATVARIALQVSDSVTFPLALEVGQSGGYMTFALTS